MADCSSKLVAVVAPFRRAVTDAATEPGHDQAPAAPVSSGPEKVSVNRQLCSENTQDTAGTSEVSRQSSSSTVSYSVVQPDVSDDDLTTCPFYHGNVTSDEAKRRLTDTSPGTYLLRDSQSFSFPLSVTVRTSGRSGVTSLRIARDADRFRLDCSEANRSLMPTFESVQRLVRHFVAEADGGEGGRCLLVGSSGCHEQPLTLRQPLNRPNTEDDHITSSHSPSV